ncbi:MAG: hypothetical protein HY465_00410 [Deltaproteobacteria bacterium]|nr:hypothetical protein [Deltaproteobacteria bacterium]
MTQPVKTQLVRVVSAVDAESYIAAHFPSSSMEMADDGTVAIYDAVSGSLIAEIFPDGRAHIYDPDGSVTYVDAHGRVEGREDVALATSLPAEKITEYVFTDDEVIVIEVDRRVAIRHDAQRFADEPPTVVIDDPVIVPPAAQIVATEDDEITAREVMPVVEADERGDEVVVTPSMSAEQEEAIIPTTEVELSPTVVWSADTSGNAAAVYGAGMMVREFIDGDEVSSNAVTRASDSIGRMNVLMEPALLSGPDGFRHAVFQEVRRAVEPVLFPVHSLGDVVTLSRGEEGRNLPLIGGDRHVARAPRDDLWDISSRTASPTRAASFREGVSFDFNEVARAVQNQIVFTVPGTTSFGKFEVGFVAGQTTIPVVRIDGEASRERRPFEVVDPSSRQGDPPDHQGSDKRHQSGSEEDQNNDFE